MNKERPPRRQNLSLWFCIPVGGLLSSLAENKDFDTAILKLKEAEKEKEKRLEMLKEINSIWKQIDDLLSSGQ